MFLNPNYVLNVRFNEFRETWLNLIKQDQRFDLFELQNPNLDSSLIYFRLTGARYFQFSYADLKLRGIDIDFFNKSLVENVNMLGGNNLLCLATNLLDYPKSDYFEPSSVWLALSIDIDDDGNSINSRWNSIQLEGEKILDFSFKNVHHCRCPI